MMGRIKRLHLRPARKRILGLVMLFFACYMASAPMIQTFADPLPPTEVQALTEWTNWVTANCGTIPAPSTAPSGGSSGGGTGPTIVIDPGHSGKDISDTDPATGLYDHDYPNTPEITEVYSVAQQVQQKLESDGYHVVMTKSSANDSVSLRDRANVADDANADLALSIHDSHDTSWNDMGGGDGGQVYVQKVGDYRQNSGGLGRGTGKVTFNDDAIAKKSQQYGQTFAEQRTQDEGHKVEVAPISFDGRAGLASGNIPEVMLFAKVPWVYNEVGAPSGPLSQAELSKYAQGLIDGVEKSIPPSGGSATPDTSGSGCACTAGASDTSGDISGKATEKDIWDYFKGKGLSDEQVAGILGNIDDETGGTYDPQIVQGGGRSKTQPKTGGADGWGLVQWTYPQQDVQQIFNDYKDKYKLSGNLYDSQTQLDIIWAQMNETSPTGVNNMVKGLKGINNPGLAATYFSDNFEGGVPGSRISDALIIYNKYKGTGPSGAGASTGPSGAAAGSTVTTSDTLNGHKLPATVGGTGQESFFPSYALGSPANQNEDNFYITMRWRYAKWNWDGTSVPGPEDIGFYQKHPKVLVTNPRNHKSIIAIALESGPAPWTGVDSGPNNTPKEGWTNPQDGTPPQYKGRVSGFPPPGIQALGAIQEMNDGATGDKLEFAWAPDQNAKPGPTDLSVDNVTSSTSCATVGSGSNDDIVKVAQQELALGLVGTGPLNNGGPVCKYQGSGCPQAWCADFVSWVYKAAGKPFTGGSDGGWRLSLASDVTGYFLSRKSQPDIGYGTPSGGDTMEPGWAVSFSGAQPGARGIGHVGIVTAVHGSSFDDIEGNGAGSGVSANKNISMSSAIDWGGYK